MYRHPSECGLQDIPSQLGSLSRVLKVTGAQAQQLIDQLQLKTVQESWHYSWDVARFFSNLYLVESNCHTYLFSDQPISYISAPAPLFSNDPSLTRLTAHLGRFFPYWFLRFNGFADFLERRSQKSSHPQSNFPTKQTYPRIKAKKGGLIERLPIIGHENLFTEEFSRWKSPKFQFDGVQCLEYYRKVNPQVLPEWFYFYRLRNQDTGLGQGVMLTIEDGKSAAMLNLANEPGFGVMMIVQSLELMDKLGYTSFNAGVSGAYGHYKNLIFLDTLPTDANGFMPLGIV